MRLLLTRGRMTNIKHFPGGRAPNLSFLFTFKRPWDYYSHIKISFFDHDITTHYSTYIKNLPVIFAPPPYLSFLFTFNRPWDYYSQEEEWRISNIFLGAEPLIYPFFLHSKDHEITTHISKYQTFSWGLSPRPLIHPFFFLSIDHEITIYYSLQHKYQTFLTPLPILPVYIQ